MARTSSVLTIAFGVFLATVKDVCCYDVCYHKHGTIYCQGEYEYCCYNDKSCCTHTHLTVSGIVGIVVGSVFVIGCLITLICICKRKQKNRPTVIIQPHTYPGTVSYTAYQGQLHHGQDQYGFNSYNTQYGIVAPGQSSSAVQTGFTHPAPGFAPATRYKQDLMLLKKTNVQTLQPDSINRFSSESTCNCNKQREYKRGHFATVD